MTIHRSDRVSTENGWKSILLENVNHFNLNRFGLKRLIPIEHDLRMHELQYTYSCSYSLVHILVHAKKPKPNRIKIYLTIIADYGLLTARP